MPTMASPDVWENDDEVINYCAKQLLGGHLAVVLGAGASIGFGLPGWTKLVDQAFGYHGAARPSGMDDESAAEYLESKVLHGDEAKFAETIRESLFDGVAVDADALSRDNHC